MDLFKSKLIVKGYFQIYGLHYNETYVAIAKVNSIKTLLSLVVAEDCDIIQFDTKTVLFHEDLDDKIFMDLLNGYSLPNNDGKVCLLKKSLYGLKQANRQ